MPLITVWAGRSAAKLLTKDETRPAAKVAKLPDLLREGLPGHDGRANGR